MQGLHHILALSILVAPSSVCAEEYTQRTLDFHARNEIVERICAMLTEQYVFVEKTENICHTLKTAMKSAKYDTISVPSQFAAVLTKEIQIASKDAHLKVRFKKGA